MDINNSLSSKAFFLDRDGVINFDSGYVHKKEDFEFLDGVFIACNIIKEHGYKIIIITNQAGIGRGYYSEDDFKLLNKWMVDVFVNEGIIIDDVYFCPHHPESATGHYLLDCECRKPQPGLILKALSEHNISPDASVMVGDKVSDIEAAKRANIKSSFFVKSRYKADGVNKEYQSLLEVVQDYFKVTSK